MSMHDYGRPFRGLTPFESGIRPLGGWRWYAAFMREYVDRMTAPCEHDMMACLVRRGLVCA